MNNTQSDQEKLYSDEKLSTSTYKCPNCGGEAIYDATSQKMLCQYCGSKFDIQTEGTISEKDLTELLSEATVWNETQVYQCQSCGAKEIISNKDIAKECSFCGNNNIVKSHELPGLKPQGIVPFKMPMEKVASIAKSWIKKKFYAPRKFKQSAKAENIRSIYSPVFTFDTQTQSTYEGKLGKHYTVNGKTYTRYFHIRGNHNYNFDDYIVQASSSIPTKTMHEISPFSTNGAPKYNEDYLRGHVASTYNKDGRSCWTECQTLMTEEIKKQILSKQSYDVVSYLNVNTAYLKQKYKYVLVPVYIGHHTYKGKLYNFYINGETGKITGKTPISGFKVFLTVLAVLAVIAGILYLS